MMDMTITLSEHTYTLLAERAAQSQRPVTEIAEEALEQYLLPSHPYVEKVRMTSDWRPVIKGTRIPVSIIVSYTRIGQTPEILAQEILPHLSLAAIYDALSYYHDHREAIEREIEENTRMADPKYLRERVGEEQYLRMTGQLK
jgi:uncharacterized protein (DUF433 family)